MVRQTTLRRFVATAIAAVFAAMPAAMCLVGAASTRAEQACSTMTHGDEGGSALQQHCCAVDAPNSSAILSFALHVIAAPPSCVDTHVFGIDFTDPPIGVTKLDAFALHPPHSPTYLLLSVFRI